MVRVAAKMFQLGKHRIVRRHTRVLKNKFGQAGETEMIRKASFVSSLTMESDDERIPVENIFAVATALLTH